MELYFAIIADLIASKKISDRARAQQNIEKALQTVNKRYAKHLASKFTLTLGDEFQGLLQSDAPLMEIIDELELRIRPYRCRVGIGMGAMATAIDPERSLGADGQAYWNARAAIDYVHANDDYEMTHTYLLGFEKSETALLNNTLALTDGLKSKWTDLQWETFAKMREEGIYEANFDQKTLAKDLNISEQALYRRLKLSGIKVYVRSRSQLQAYLREKVSAYESDRVL